MARSYGNFDLQQTINLDFAEAVVEKWRSQRTGLSIVHIEYEGRLDVWFFFDHENSN